ncbi:MAG: SPOR domain-containing protein [bacterium]
MKQALGLAVSGTEVRLAHLISHNGQIRIEGLERAKLKTTLENQPLDKGKAEPDEAEAKDAFGLKDTLGDKAPGDNEQKTDNGNLEILYRLLEKYTKKKTKIAFNIPLSMVTYQRPDVMATIVERAGGTDKDAESNLGQEHIMAHDGATIVMSYEKHPPTMTLMREVNEFVRGNLFLALMDPTEVALANLVRRSSDLDGGKITAIVYVEDDFTRLVFMRGKDLFHVSSIIHENAASPDILDVIYRKLLYEQDEAGIPEIAAIWLAGKSTRINAAEFFASYFPAADVRYLSSSMLGGLSSTEAQRGVFSEFAVPIALAWKTLEPKSPFFIPTNLLPQDLLDQQQVLKLKYHGYALLALTGIAAFFITWQIIELNSNIRETRAKNTQLEMQISNNQSTVDRVFQLDNQCQRLGKNLHLADSLSQGHDELLTFLQKLNASVERTGGVWVDEIVKQKDGFSVKGTSMNRDAIPQLAEKLENASLSQVTRIESEAAKRKAFRFSLERNTPPDQVQLSGQGISTIETAHFASNGNLILGRRGVSPGPPQTPGNVPPRPASTPNGLVPPSASNDPNAQRARQPVESNGDSKAGDLAKRNGAVPPGGIIRPATSTQPAKEDIRANPSNKATAATSTPANSKSNLPIPAAPRKTENITARAADGIARTTAREMVSFDLSDDRGPQAPVPPSIKTANGTTANGSTQASNREMVQTLQPTPEASNPKAPKPAVPAVEIYRAYTIEAATSYTKELAGQFAAAYRKQGYDAAVETYNDERSGTGKYRVLIGAFATRPAAEQKAAQIAGILMKDYRVVGLK